MELSIFLAKVFGIYLLVMGTLWIVRRDALLAVIEEFFANRGLVFLSGMLALAVGICIAVSHSVWEFNWRGLITLFGYASIAKGISRVAYPNLPHNAIGSLMQSTMMWVWIAVIVVIGGYLTWVGFTLG